jgi:hypothetical protein
VSARDELAQAIASKLDELFGHRPAEPAQQDYKLADAILAAGYSKPRRITTPAEANSLPDRAAFLTPGDIIFLKCAGYYGEGKDAWERELGQMVPAELLSAEGHFPATVLHEGATK